jgi:uncharacterized membrane protein YgcG
MNRSAFIVSTLILAIASATPLAVAQQRSSAQGPSVGAVPEVVHPSVGLRVRTDVKFDAVPLVDVLEYLASQGRMNMVVNWSALELAGIDRNVPVTLNLRGVSVMTALRIMTRSVSNELAFDVDDNILVISTREQVDARLVTRIYSISDLLTEVPDFEGPEISLGNSGGGDSGGGGGIFSGQGSQGGNADRDNALTRDDRAEQIIELIQATVEPDVWDVNGGRASIRYFAGNLVVTGPMRVHGLFR